MKILFIIIIGLAIGINLFAFVAEKIMKKKIAKVSAEKKEH